MASHQMQPHEDGQQTLTLAGDVDFDGVLAQIEARRVALLERAQRITKLFQVDREMRLIAERARQSRDGAAKFTFAPLFPKHTPLPRDGVSTLTGLSITWQYCRGSRKQGPEGGMRVRAVRHVKGLVNNLYRPEALLAHALPCEAELVWATEVQFGELRAQWRPYGLLVSKLKQVRYMRTRVAALHAAAVAKAQPAVREQLQALGVIS